MATHEAQREYQRQWIAQRRAQFFADNTEKRRRQRANKNARKELIMREKLLSVTLKDCDVQTKRGSGAGGQNRNKRDTAVKIVHRASGAVGESQEQRSQLQNKQAAFKRMAQTSEFKV